MDSINWIYYLMISVIRNLLFKLFVFDRMMSISIILMIMNLQLKFFICFCLLLIEMYQIEKSSDRNMLPNQGFKSKSVLPPIYIEQKCVSDDSVYDEELSAHKLQIHNHRKSIKQYPKQIKSINLIGETQQHDQSIDSPYTNTLIIVDIIIWILFFICSIKTREDHHNLFFIIDCCTSSIAILRTSFQIIKMHKITMADAIYIANFLFSLVIILQQSEQLYTIMTSLRSLRIILIIVVIESLYKTLNIILQAIKGIWKIGLCILVVCLIYCLIGIQLYKGDLQYRCRISEIPEDSYWQTDNQVYLCGSRQCQGNYYCESTYKYNLQQNLSEFESQKILYGYVNFDSIYNAFFTIFHLIVGIGWSEIVFIHSDYYTKYVSYIFFVSFMIIGPLIMMNILVGLLYQQYVRLKQKQLKQLEESQKRKTKTVRKSLNIMKVSVLAKKIQQIKEKQSNPTFNQTKSNTEIVQEVQKPILTAQNIKKGFFHIVILIQLIVTCLDHYNLNAINNRNNGITLGVCFIFYSFQIITILYIFTVQGIKKQKNVLLRLLDIFIYLVNLSNYILKIIQNKYIFEQDCSISPFAQSLICIRFIIVLQENIFDSSLEILIKSLYKTIRQLVPFLGIIFVICLTGGAVSMQIFQNNLKMVGEAILPMDQLEKGRSPLINFDNYLTSWISFSSFILNQQWQVTMYRLIRANNSIIIIYFVITIFLFTFIFIKLFVAVYINTYLQTLKKAKIFKDQIIDKTPICQKITIALKQKSLFILDENNIIRKFTINLIQSDYYKYSFFIILFIYCILLIFYDAFEPQTGHIIYSVFDIIFLFDMLIKIIAFKMFGDYSYTKDGINLMDLTINITVIINLFTYDIRQYIRALRACRIIILTQIFTQLKIIMVSIYKSLLDLMRLIFILLTFLLFFSTLSMKYLKGSTYSCTLSIYISKTQCMDYGGNWINNLGIGFDNIFQSIFNIFSIITSQGWLSIMQVVMQSRGLDLAISTEQINYWWGLFFIPMFFIGNLIFINIFVGVLIQKVQIISNAYDEFQVSIKDLPKHHQQWARIKNYIFKIKPEKSFKRPLDWKKYLFDSLQSEQYNFFNKFMVLLNVCVFACFYHRQSMEFFNFLNVMNQICYFIFLIQFIFQVYLYGYQRKYLYIDMITIMVSAPGVTLIYFPVNLLNSADYPNITQLIIFLNALQIMRCYKIFTEFKIIATTFNNILSILPRVSSVFAMFFIFLFIFAILGEDLFSNIMFNNSITSRTINFTTFFDSIFALFKIMTGQFWFENAIDLSRELEFGYFCGISNTNQSQCGSKYNLVFFVIFFLILGIIFLNLLIATILMLTVQSLNLEKSATRRYKLNNFLQLWKKYDQDGQGFINYKIFFQFSMIMAMQYGIDKSQFHKISKKKMFMKILNIPVYQNIYTKQYCYLIYDVGICMSRAALLLREPESFDFLLNENSQTATSLQNMPNPKKFLLTNMNSGNMSTIILMMQKLRKWKKRATSQDANTDINKFFGS